MEQQIAELTAQMAEQATQMAELQTKAGVTNRTLAELFYFLTIPLMVIIHVGFLTYEMGASRHKNVLASGIKNILAFAFVLPAFYFFGWWIYWAFPTGLTLSAGASGASGLAYANEIALPWVELMGPNLDDNISGVFWGAFAMFGATAAAIFSGAVIERIQMVGFTLLALVLGAMLWNLASAWGWHIDGWMVQKLGFHDFGAAGVVHAVAGFFSLGVLINLGPRIGRFSKDSEDTYLGAHNLPFTLTGFMLIIVGFWGFFMACLIVPGETWSGDAGKWTNIYGTPITLSAISFNILMGFSGGVIGAWLVTRDPFWMLSGALAGMISCGAGLDMWWPPLAFVIGFAGGGILKPIDDWLASKGMDDPVGVVAVHGVSGFWSMIAVGIFAFGSPAIVEGNAITISFLGQATGALVCAALGFIPGYILSRILKRIGMLRVSEKAEINGLDATKVPVSAYPDTR